jgi:hypothetical protein
VRASEDTKDSEMRFTGYSGLPGRLADEAETVPALKRAQDTNISATVATINRGKVPNKRETPAR